MSKTPKQFKGAYALHCKKCEYCGCDFDGNNKAKYHSNACRQAAYRARKTTPIERAIRRVERYKKMVATKAATIIETTCCGCGCKMFVTGIQGRGKMYHNTACRQRAYRERKALRQNAVPSNDIGERS